MAMGCSGVKTCVDCKQKCSILHSNTSNTLTFLKVMDDHSSPFLEIPSEYTEQIKSNGCRYAILEGPCGCLWLAILCCCGTSPVFKDGWENFVSDHSIQLQDVVVFRQARDSHFLVQVFEPSGIEKQTSHKKRHSKLQSFCVCRNHGGEGLSAKRPIILDGEEKEWPYKHRNSNGVKGTKSETSQCEDLRSAKSIKRGEQKFSKVMKKASVTNSFWLNLPKGFARRWLPQARIEVQLLCRRKQWQVTYVGTREDLGFGPGWKNFVLDNQLKTGDTCCFELKDTENYIFTVKISRTMYENWKSI